MLKEFKRIISPTQSNYKVSLQKKNVTQQCSYNLPIEMESFLIENHMIKEVASENVHYKNYLLEDGVKIILGEVIIALIGDSYLNIENKAIFTHTEEASGSSPKLQLKKTEFEGKNLEEYKWFSELYAKNFEGANFVARVDTDKKEISFDIEITDKAFRKPTIKELFSDWLKPKVTVKVCGNYVSAINTISEKIGKNLFDITDLDRLDEILASLDKDNTFKEEDERSHRTLSSGLGKYRDFIAEIFGKTIKRDVGGFNKIYYGCPGCGKSHYVRELLKNSNVDKDNIFTVTFHPEYSNYEFVGQLIPKVDNEGKVTYEFIKGPFTLALERALSQGKMVYLIIEEINRGNAAGIFGDLFQLLDRDTKNEDSFGRSEYEINNVNIQRELAKDNLAMENEKVFLPSNFTILATMNTCDQNVFTLDTAFKRRWEFEHISNDFTDKDTIGEKYIAGTNVKWKTFVKDVNTKISKQGISDSISDDRRIGKYFIDESLLCDTDTHIKNGDGTINDEIFEKAKKFGFKILEYIWNDVAKGDQKNDWFDTSKNSTLEELISSFVDKNIDNPLAVFLNLK